MVIILFVPLSLSPSLRSNFTEKSFGAKLLFFFPVIAPLNSHWLTHKTLHVFTADGNQGNPYQAHHYWQERHQPGDLVGAQNPEPDWQVVSLLILQAPIRMVLVCDARKTHAQGKLGLADSILTLQAIFWQHAGSLFILLLWLVSLG